MQSYREKRLLEFSDILKQYSKNEIQGREVERFWNVLKDDTEMNFTEVELQNINEAFNSLMDLVEESETNGIGKRELQIEFYSHVGRIMLAFLLLVYPQSEYFNLRQMLIQKKFLSPILEN